MSDDPQFERLLAKFDAITALLRAIHDRLPAPEFCSFGYCRKAPLANGTYCPEHTIKSLTGEYPRLPLCAENQTHLFETIDGGVRCKHCAMQLSTG